ncbi:MAG: ribosome maturation factor RimP [Lachnospiraceae bacterium]|jgi:ribosome maturation factor RimP|nr:ribosome maturation factor RimP [Lachnospiraceae bacterium]
MSQSRDYEAKTEALLGPIVEKMGLGIYDVEYVKEGGDYILRAYIDKDGGVNINDCETVSRTLSAALDERDFIPGSYVLEVSSPGLTRQLTKDKHFEKSLGAEVEIKTYKPLGNRKEFCGKLVSFDRESVTIENTEGAVTLNRADIAVIRLMFPQDGKRQS